ncbi:S-layer homology domain-containing protein [Hominenteromicrobium sp.]|uniref:S-layer homology domain-containing protein n=1 Tax=Hominenteromicrobium sp. TaxID=3073581 RepID=UPI003A8F41DA
MPLPPERARAFEAAGKQGCDCVAWSRKRRTGFISRQGVWAVENGVTNGIGDGLFGPDNSCTRAQIVTFLFRAYQGK